MSAIFKSFIHKYLINFWDVSKAMLFLGMLSAVYFGVFGGVWAVTGEMTRWGGEFLELFGMDLSGFSYYQKQNLNGTPLTRTDGVMLIAMFVGCLVASLWANKVKFRLPASSMRVMQAIIGGLLSGFGARLAFGCNLANFFTGLPYFSLHTWVFTLFMVIGIYLAVRVCKMRIFEPQAKLVKCNTAYGLGIHKDEGRVKRHFIYGCIVFAIFLVAVAYVALHSPALDAKNKKSLLYIALIFGFIFGFVIAKGQVCFTSCFRDLFLFGRDIASKAAFSAMILAAIIAFAFVLQGQGTKVVELSPAIALGGFLFGFGIVFAGGCECGWMFRSCEGQVHFIIVGVANIVGTMILALSYDKMPSWLIEGQKVNLITHFGKFGALMATIAMLVCVLLLIFAYKTYFFRRLTNAKS